MDIHDPEDEEANEELYIEPIKEELEEAIKMFKFCKATGKYHITPEIIEFMRREGTDKLAE